MDSVRTYMPVGRAFEPADDPHAVKTQLVDALADPEYREQIQGLRDITAALEGKTSTPVVFSTDAESVLNRKMTIYMVKDEHTLGYSNGSGNSMEVLHGSVFKGGHDWKNGSVYILAGHTKLRPATLEDFKTYRVVPPPGFDVEANQIEFQFGFASQ